MSNATDQAEYIRNGFAELIAMLDARVSEAPSHKIRSNTEARERALNRVCREYADLGLVPPSDLALSVTARRELGIGIAYQEAAE